MPTQAWAWHASVGMAPSVGNPTVEFVAQLMARTVRIIAESLVILGIAAALQAQQPGMHALYQGSMPPGAIGSLQLQRGGALPGFFQPVEIQAPPGVSVCLAAAGRFDQPQAVPARVGMLIGAVYRLRVMNVPLHPGQEVFPTVELMDRTYAPVGQELQFPIPVELTQEDLELALAGNYITRVIYLEDPRNALPARTGGQPQNWFDVGPGRDPLAVADVLGRPVAILRMGSRVPDANEQSSMSFLYGCPPWLKVPQPAASSWGR